MFRNFSFFHFLSSEIAFEHELVVKNKNIILSRSIKGTFCNNRGTGVQNMPFLNVFLVFPVWLPIFFLFFLWVNQNYVQESILAWLFHYIICIRRVSNPQPLNHELSLLTTWPWTFAKIGHDFSLHLGMKGLL